MADKGWLQKLKVGDLIIVQHVGESSVRKVARLTKLYIVDQHGYRFRKTDGHRAGFNGRRAWGGFLRKATPAAVSRVRNEVHRCAIAHSLADVKWASFGLETLKAVKALVDEEIQTTDGE